MKLPQLPSEMLSAIAKRLPIADLGQVGLVCHRLNDVQQSRLPSVLSRAKSLRIDYEPSKRTLSTLEADFYGINQRHDVMVKFSQDNRNRFDYDLLVSKNSLKVLATMFPNITRLTIVVYWSANEGPLDVLSFWPNLTALTIVGCKHVFKPWMARQANSIYQLKLLKALVMDVPLYRMGSTLKMYARLEHLTCKLYNAHESPAEHKFRHYVEAIIETMTLHPNIKSVGLWLENDYGFVDYSNWPSQVTNRVTRLVHLDAPPLDVICDKFGSLTYLHVHTSGLTLASALPSLSKLLHLKVLHLRIEGGRPPAKDSNLPLLKSVKKVTFLTPLDPHQLVAFGAFFPNALRVGFKVGINEWPTLRGLLCNNANCANCTFLRLHNANVFNPHVEQTIQVWLD